MKKTISTTILILSVFCSFAQTPTYHEKLYYSCKVWGFLKYYHTGVSASKMNWDSVLVSNLQEIRLANTAAEFNKVLNKIIVSAGQMELTSTPSPDTLPVELKRNLDFKWISDPIFTDSVRLKLHTVSNNFRPHPNRYVKMVNENRSIQYYSDKKIEDSRIKKEDKWLLAFFNFWNYHNYFNPNLYLLDDSWDSVLYKYVEPIATSKSIDEFRRLVDNVCMSLNDMHVETSSFDFTGVFTPSITVRYIQNEYVVVDSDIKSIQKGDIIEKVEGVTPTEWEKRLQSNISAGNPSIFRKLVSINMFAGPYLSSVKISYTDRYGNSKSKSIRRKNVKRINMFHFPNDTLRNVKWKKLNSNIGYVNMGMLGVADIDSMYKYLKNSSAIIFDLRCYPQKTLWALAPVLSPDRICFAKLLVPSATYPGTFTIMNDSLGTKGNKNSYKGRIVVLCNEETLSQAEYTCMLLKAMPNTIIVGSQTAGADGNLVHNIFNEYLPCGYSGVGVYYPNGMSAQRVGIIPDIEIKPTIEGIRNNRDEVLEKAIKIANETTVQKSI